MFRTGKFLAAALILTGSLVTASAETTTAPATAPAPAASKLKLTREKLKEWREQWKKNHPKLVACRKEVKARGLTGDDRWFFISECMGKS